MRTKRLPANQRAREAVILFTAGGFRFAIAANAVAFKPQRVLVLRNGPVALLADTTDRILEITLLHELPLGFTRDERTWYRGLAVVDGDVVPVVSHSGFLSRSELMVLSVAMERLLADQKRAAAV